MFRHKTDLTFLDAFEAWLKTQDLTRRQEEFCRALVGDLQAFLTMPASFFHDPDYVKAALRRCRDSEFVGNVVDVSLAHISTKH